MAGERIVQNMWDIASDLDGDADNILAIREAVALRTVEVADSGTEMSPSRRAGRARTRLLGVDHANGALEALDDTKSSNTVEALRFPVGWLAVIAGPGLGMTFSLGAGVSQIGRGDDQAVRLDFGDTSISREGHAVVAYDDEAKGFFVGYGGKSNMVRLNDKPLLSTEPISQGDRIRIGETTLMFVALCGADFSWGKNTH